MYVVATERGTRRGEERRWTRRIQVGRREEISQMRAREGGDVSVKKIKNRVKVKPNTIVFFFLPKKKKKTLC